MSAKAPTTRDLERARGLALHKEGRLAEARALYEEVLRGAPADGETLALLGALEHQCGAYDLSARLLTRAVTLRPAPDAYANLALSLIRLSRLGEAEGACRAALALQPGNLEARVSLGGVLHALGRHREASQTFEEATRGAPARSDLRAHLAASRLADGDLEGALEAATEAEALDPGNPMAPFHRGGALAAMGRLEAAQAAYEAALAVEPRLGSAAENLGAVLRRQGRTLEAAQAYARALDAAPDRIPALVMRAGLLVELGRFADAAAPARRILELDPSHGEARLLLGLVLVETGAFAEGARLLEAAPGEGSAALPRLCALAKAYKETFAYDRAVEVCAAAETLDDDPARGAARLGAALEDAGRHGEAARACLRALQSDPHHLEASVNLAAAWTEQGRLAGAVRLLKTVLERHPADPPALRNLAVALYRQGRTGEALAVFDRLPGAAPPAHRFNHALALLKAGRFEAGWAAFEARRVIPGRETITRSRDLPSWRGEGLGQATLLIEGEQGLGDALQCLRFVRPAAARVGAIRLRVQEPLRRIAASLCGEDALLLEEADLGGADIYAPLFSLPGIFAPTGREITGTPYITPCPQEVEAWRGKLAPGRLRVGVAWQGNPGAAVERGRSFPLELALWALARPGVEIVSLQKDHGLDQAEAPLADGRMRELGPEYEAGDLATTAAVVSCLDLVVTCDTALAHLGGAVGTRTWIALNRVCDWRWGDEGEASPWYGSVRLFRQGADGAWAGLFAAMARALDDLVS